MLFQNNGDGTYRWAYAVGLDSNDDGYMASVADLNLDGRPDLVLRNCDPGTTAYSFPSLRIYQNQQPQSASQLAIKLVGNGTDTNRDAIGAQIKVFADGQDTPMIVSCHGKWCGSAKTLPSLASVRCLKHSESRCVGPMGMSPAMSIDIGRHVIEQPK